MLNRVLGAVLVACLAVAALAAAPPAGHRPQWVSGDGYDWWADCSDIPSPFEFLPIYVGSEAPGLVDLGRVVTRGGARWRAQQYTRDKDLGPTRASTGVWYSGMGADEWPAQTVDVRRQLDAFRVLAWEIDGNRHAVDPSCTAIVATDDLSIGFYNAWARFTEPGLHTLKIIGRQLHDFYFIFPLAELGLMDPYALEGRRVLLAGESVGDVLDGDFIHTYELHVGRDDQP